MGVTNDESSIGEISTEEAAAKTRKVCLDDFTQINLIIFI